MWRNGSGISSMDEIPRSCKESSRKKDLNPRVSKPNNDANPKSKPTKLNTSLPPGGEKNN